MGKLIQLLFRLIAGASKKSSKPPIKSVPKPPKELPKEKPSSIAKCPPDCTAATKEEILEGAKPGKVSSSRQYSKPGGLEQANKDFDALTRGGKIQDRGGGLRTAEMSDGSKVIVRPTSSGGQSTLEIQPLSGKPTKIRYD